MRRKIPALEPLRGLALPEDDAAPLLDFYQSRSPTQEERIAEAAMALRRSGTYGGDELLLYLAAFGRGPGMRAAYPDLLTEGALSPGIVWRFAGDQAVPALARHLGKSTRETDRALEALAWCRSPASVALFDSWRRAPPGWSSLLHWAPHRYTMTAGWMLTNTGAVRQLYDDHCVPLGVTAADEAHTHEAWTALDEPCGFCGRPMASLLPGATIANSVNVATCLVCTCYGEVFSRQGPTRWAPENARPEHLPPSDEAWDLPKASLAAGPARPPIVAAHYDLPISASQIGGHPTWLQDPAFPSCSRCGDTMPFIAQLDLGDVEKHGEGTYYAFRCGPCGLAATCYQQT